MKRLPSAGAYCAKNMIKLRISRGLLSWLYNITGVIFPSGGLCVLKRDVNHELPVFFLPVRRSSLFRRRASFVKLSNSLIATKSLETPARQLHLKQRTHDKLSFQSSIGLSNLSVIWINRRTIFLSKEWTEFKGRIHSCYLNSSFPWKAPLWFTLWLRERLRTVSMYSIIRWIIFTELE